LRLANSILLYWQRQYGTKIAEIREIFDLQKAFDVCRPKYVVCSIGRCFPPSISVAYRSIIIH